MRDEINKRYGTKKDEGYKLLLRSNGAVLEMKRTCDEILQSNLGRMSSLRKLWLLLEEIEEVEMSLAEHRRGVDYCESKNSDL